MHAPRQMEQPLLQMLGWKVMRGDTFHGFLFWVLFWITGIGPVLLLLYIPIGVAWVVGCGLYLVICRILRIKPTFEVYSERDS